jgi:hypothetical protein
MKSLLLLPFLAAAVFAANHLEYAGQLAADAEGVCHFRGVDGTIIDASALPSYNNTAMSVSGMPGYFFQLSPCAPVNFTTECSQSFAYIAKGAASSCFATPPVGNVNGTGNGTKAYTTYTSGQMKSSYLAVALATTLDIVYYCNETGAKDELTLIKASQRGERFTIEFSTVAVCNLVPDSTPAPPTTTAPVDDNKGDDNKLSTWAIVGIIVGAVVLIVGVGVACWKCRSSNPEEAEYRHVA